jgi:hypothetical protein
MMRVSPLVPDLLNWLTWLNRQACESAGKAFRRAQIPAAHFTQEFQGEQKPIKEASV